MKINTILDSSLESYHQEMIEELQKLLRYKTVGGIPVPQAPFGEEIGNALNYIMELGKKKGFDCINYDGYACEINCGDGETSIGVVSHLDVVPEGQGWTFNPYGGEISNGRIYGRGAVDDKGPLIAAFYACLAIKESGLPISCKIKHIIGTDEESGKFECIKYYKDHAEIPDRGIVPDSWFPAVYAEKGFVNFKFTKETKVKDKGDLVLKVLNGGEAFNIVAPHAFVEFEASDFGIKQVSEVYKNLKKKSDQEDIDISESNGILRIEFTGKAAHASVPKDGRNAISLLLRFLKKIDFSPADICNTLHKLSDKIGEDSDGSGLGIDFEDHTGALTNNVGTIDFNQHLLEVKMNLRCPVTMKIEELYLGLMKAAKSADMNYELINYNPHFYIDPETPLFKLVMDSYREVTGEDNSQPKAHGGGSYARILENFIPFGPSMQDEELIFHKQDEYISIGRLLLLSKIYARALYRMALLEKS